MPRVPREVLEVIMSGRHGGGMLAESFSLRSVGRVRGVALSVVKCCVCCCVKCRRKVIYDDLPAYGEEGI
jgi:hypothetical protein